MLGFRAKARVRAQVRAAAPLTPRVLPVREREGLVFPPLAAGRWITSPAPPPRGGTTKPILTQARRGRTGGYPGGYPGGAARGGGRGELAQRGHAPAGRARVTLLAWPGLDFGFGCGSGFGFGFGFGSGFRVRVGVSVRVGVGVRVRVRANPHPSLTLTLTLSCLAGDRPPRRSARGKSRRAAARSAPPRVRSPGWGQWSARDRASVGAGVRVGVGVGIG